MSNTPRKISKGFLSTTAIAGLAAAMFATGVPAPITHAFADAVRVEAPQAPSLPTVVESRLSPRRVRARSG